MSMDISAAPAAGPKTATSHRHAHAKAGDEDAGAFTDILSGKAKHAASTENGETQAKPVVHGATKWQAREHAQWRVLDTAKGEPQDKTAEPDDATQKEAPTEGEEQVQQVAVLLPHPAKETAAKTANGDQAKEGAAIASEAGVQAAAIVAAAQPDRNKRPAAGAAQHGALEPHAVEAKGGQRQSAEPVPVPTGRDGPVEARKPGDVAATAHEAGHERGQRAQEREPAGERPASKVTVVSVQTAPAPAAPAAAPGLSPTAASFVQSLGAADGLPRYVSETGTQGGTPNAPKPITTLKIQLHPVDLGTVTAKLSGDSEKLSIEVRVENHEAHHRLQSDSDAIVKVLRGMGFDIDRITVQQAPQTGASAGGATNRENAFAAPDQRAGDGRGQSGRQDSGRGYYEEGRNQGGGSDRGEVRGSGGVYI